MASIFKTGLLFGGLMLLGTGGYVATYTPGWKNRIPWKVLAECSSIDDYEGKWGGRYARFLLGSKHKENKEYWGEKFEKSQAAIMSTVGKFSTVKEPYLEIADEDSLDDTYLNHVCHSAYKAELNKIKFKDVNKEAGEFKDSELWAFCSVWATRIITLNEFASEAEDYSKIKGKHTYGNEETYKSLMIATSEDAKSNDKIWEKQKDVLQYTKTKHFVDHESSAFRKLRDALYRDPEDDEAVDDMGYESLDIQADESEEKKLDKQTVLVDNLVKKRNLRLLCQEAYKHEISVDGVFPKADVFKFCSISRITPDDGYGEYRND